MRSRSSRPAPLLAFVLVATGALAPATTLAAVELQLDVTIGSECVYGVKPSGGPITVKLLRADGSTKDSDTDSATGNDWVVCFDSPVRIGNRLKMTTNPGTHVETRTVTVPDLTIAVDRATDKVKGHAPANKTLQVRYADCYPPSCTEWLIRTRTSNSAGRWSKDWSSSADVDGSDPVAVIYVNAHGDQFWARTEAPYMEIKAPNKVYVGCQPRGTTTVKLRKSDGTVRATRSLTATSECSGETGSFKRNGAAVTIKAGNKVTADLADDAALTWPSMSVEGSGVNLSGHCIANAHWVVYTSRGSSNAAWSGITDGDGDFSQVTSWNFQPGDRLDLICETGRGDRVRQAWTL